MAARQVIHGLFNAAPLCQKPMTAMKFFFTTLALFAMPAVAQAQAQRRGADQDQAFRGRQAGALRPLRDIEGGIVPDMKRRGADYIGAEYDGGMGRYRLKFMRDGSVIWVDVDGRTGAVVGRAGE
ncbi:hypothetical protein BH09PSE3_BH09PSE3_19020 [soil metagenome]